MSWSFHNNRNQTETVYFLNKNGLDQEQCYKPTPPRLGRETQEDHKCEDSLYCLIKTFQKSQKTNKPSPRAWCQHLLGSVRASWIMESKLSKWWKEESSGQSGSQILGLGFLCYNKYLSQRLTSMCKNCFKPL